jgi:hypothetical protein
MVYDQTGSLADSEELAGAQFDALREYFRALYKQVGPDPWAAEGRVACETMMGL